MFDGIFKNWKTTVLGLVIGTGQWFMTYQPDAGFTWEGLGTALPTVLLGMFAGDRKKNPQ